MLTEPSLKLTDYHAIAVGLGEIKISRDPADALVAYGLGSCVAVGLYDPETRQAGLLHAILPERPKENTTDLPGKYVDSGLEAMLSQMRLSHLDPAKIIVRLVGGANMLLSQPGLARTLNIGDRNVAAAQAWLTARHFRIRAQEVGGNTGRTVRLFVAEGRMTVRTIGQPEHTL